MPNRNNEEKVTKYSIRKYKNGAASVAVGALLFSGILSGGVVEASAEEELDVSTEAVLSATEADAPVATESDTADTPVSETEESQDVTQEEVTPETSDVVEDQNVAPLAAAEAQVADTQTLADQYTPAAAEIVVSLNEAGRPEGLPSAIEGISNFDALPEGTTADFVTGNIAGRTATIVVTYADGSKDEVIAPVSVKTATDTSTDESESVDENVTDPKEENTESTSDKEAAKDYEKLLEAELEAYLKSENPDSSVFHPVAKILKEAYANLKNVDVSVDPATQTLKAVVTYADGSKDSTNLDLNAPLPSAKQFAQKFIKLTPMQKLALAQLESIDVSLDTAAQVVKVVVTYPGGSKDEVFVPFRFGKPTNGTDETDASKYEPKAIDEIVVDLNKDKFVIPTAEQAIKNFDELPKGTKAVYTNLASLDLTGKTKAQFVSILVTYPDKTTDTVNVPLRVIPVDADKPEEDKDLEKLEKQIQKLQEAIKELEKQNNKQDKELNKLQKELNKLQKQLKGSKHENKHLEREIDKLEDRVKKLEKQLRDKHDHKGHGKDKDKDHDHKHDHGKGHGKDKDRDHKHDHGKGHGKDKDRDHKHDHGKGHGKDKDRDHKHDHGKGHGKDKDHGHKHDDKRDDVKPDKQRPGKDYNDDKRDDVKPDNKAPQTEDVNKSGALPQTGSVAAVAGLGATAILTGLGLASTHKKKNDEE